MRCRPQLRLQTLLSGLLLLGVLTQGRSARRLLQDQLQQGEQLVISEEELQKELEQEDVVDFPLGDFVDEELVVSTDSVQGEPLEGTEAVSTGVITDPESPADELVTLNPDRTESSAELSAASETVQAAQQQSQAIPGSTLPDSLADARTATTEPTTASQLAEDSLADQLEGSDLILPEDLTDVATQTLQEDSPNTLAERPAAGSAVLRNSTQTNNSTNTTSPLAEQPILESALPSVEGLDDTLTIAGNASRHTTIGTLQAVLEQSESASNVTTSAHNSSSAISNSTGLLGAAAGAANRTSSALQQAASGLPLNASSLNSTLNATQTLLASSASAAAALLSNSSLLGTAANQTGNITQLAAQHASAGGVESDTLMAGHLLNATAGNATLPESRQRVADAAGSAVQDGREAASGLLSGVRSWFAQNTSSNSTNTTGASGLHSGLSTSRASANSSVGTYVDTAGRYGQLTDGEEVDLDADLELAYSGNTTSGMHHSFNAPNVSRNGTTGRTVTIGHTANATSASTLSRNASSLSPTPELSASATASNTTSARGSAGLSSAANRSPTASSFSDRVLPGSGTRQQGVSDYLDDAAYGEELTPEELAELAEEQGSLSNSNTARGGAASGSAVAQQRSSTTSAGLGGSAARNSSSGSSLRPGAGTAANPGLLDRQRADTGVVRIPIEEDDYAMEGQARTASQSGTHSGSQNSHAASSLYADDDEDTQSLRYPATGGSSSSRGTGSNSSAAGSSGAVSAAERDAAYHASTGGLPQGSSSRSSIGSIASASWGDLASRASSAFKGNSGSRQSPAASSLATELPYADDDMSDALLSGGSTGSTRMSHSGSHVTGQQQTDQLGQDDFISHRDPTNPSSVVGAHTAWGGAQSRTSQSGHSGSGAVTAGDAKVSLAADADAASHGGSAQPNVMNHLQADTDSTDGPLVVGGKEDDALLSQASSDRQLGRSSSKAHSLLGNIIDNWVVISALIALVGTGTVLGFVFVRGVIPNIDAVSFGSIGTSGYAGNTTYSSVGREEEGAGWDDDWPDEDLPKSASASHSPSSPARPTGMGKLKRGTFAKKKTEKKPDSWSNDF